MSHYAFGFLRIHVPFQKVLEKVESAKRPSRTALPTESEIERGEGVGVQYGTSVYGCTVICKADASASRAVVGSSTEGP